MDKKLKEKWVKALRSGKYPQGKNMLYDGMTGGYCCLGVLHRCAGQSSEAIDRLTFGDAPELVGDQDAVDELADMNDDGVPFEMIAGFIQETL